MKITRRHTTVGQAPYDGATLRIFSAQFDSGLASSCAATGQPEEILGSTAQTHAVDFPEAWSVEAAELLQQRGLVHAGIPARLKAVREDDVPSWLWRHTADLAALEQLSPDNRARPETGLRAAVDRIAGGWAYQGWKSGYFDADADARAFFDEIRWLLFHQRLSPEIAVWRHEGVYWAYGIEEFPCNGAITDYRTGGMRAVSPADIPPHGAVINSVDGGTTEDNTPWSLFQREATLQQAGCTLGVNLGGAATAAAILEIKAALSRVTNTVDEEYPARRRLTIEANDDGTAGLLREHGSRDARSDMTEAGQTLARRHLKAIADACYTGDETPKIDAQKKPALRFAIAAARGALVPEALIDRLIRLIRDDTSFSMDDLIGRGPTRRVQGTDLLVARVSDSLMDRVVSGKKRAAAVLDAAALASWTKGSSGLHFATTADGWNTCPKSGAIKSAAGQGDYVFLDDTAVSRMTVNIPAHITIDGDIDENALSHAASMAAVALDIAIAKTASATPRLARRSWDFRPIALSPSGIATALMMMGEAYDSRGGRASAARICSLVSGAAWATSARLAEELGPFPAWQQNAGAMQQVLRNHQRADTGDAGGYEGLGWPPLAQPAQDASTNFTMSPLSGNLWISAIERGERGGYRNAQVSVVAALDVENTLLDCATPGIEPDFSLLRFEKLPGGGFRKTLNPAIVRGLRRLGYDGTPLTRILRHVLGHGTVAGAPGINHENLRQRGFTEDALRVVEAGLEECLDITLAFSPWALGEHFCTRMLGLSKETLEGDGFDLLTALGYSEAAIEAANIYCCGANTLEGAPGLAPAHLPVFDCATEQGERGRRRLDPEALILMMAAVQPLISGGIGHTLTLPGDSTAEKCRENFMLGWRLGLKSLVINMEPAAPALLLEDAGASAAPAHARQIPLRIINGGDAQHRSRPAAAAKGIIPPAPAPKVGPAGTTPAAISKAPARASVERSSTVDIQTSRRSEAAATKPPSSIPKTIIAAAQPPGSAGDESPSRDPLSDPARSTASVSSSADVVVEQRQN